MEHVEADEELMARLRADDEYFKSMINLIPAKYYVDDHDDLAVQDSKFYHNKAGKAPKQVVKEASRKAKRQRLGPDSLKTADELQVERAAQRTAADVAESLSSLGATPGQVRSFEAENAGGAASLDDLRERLAQRLEGLRSKRKHHGQDGPQSKAKRKSLSKKQVKEQRLESVKLPSTSNGIESSQRPGIVDEEGRVVFSKFDFSSSQRKKGVHKKDYNKLLARAEGRQKRMEELQKKDETVAAEKMEKQTWNRALQKAEGVKLVDDPKLLKKTIKRKEQMKKHSQKKWDERVGMQKKRQAERQEKRQKNLRERIQGKKGKGKTPKGKGKSGGKPSKGRKPGF